NGSGAFFPTIICGFVLVALHRVMAAIAFRSHRFGELVKGADDLLVENGEIQWRAMRKNAVTERDLLERVRLHGVESIRQIKSARMERNGDFSVICREG
ncbi:MAG TPA: YetF domain-containing protein, partial [Candidatus Binatia bacterium]|nr:YetF domain-containing protein [Candidatus Binatia bacterium]